MVKEHSSLNQFSSINAVSSWNYLLDLEIFEESVQRGKKIINISAPEFAKVYWFLLF